MGHYLSEMEGQEPRGVRRLPVLYIGIDPGMSGGIATLHGGKAHVDPMPETEADIWYLFRSLAKSYVEAVKVALIEQVTGYVGGVGNTGSSQFKFGTNYGLCRMACIASGVRLEQVTPNVWQRALGIPPRKNNRSSSRRVGDKKD